MAWTTAAKSAWKPRLQPRKSPTQWFTQSCLKTTNQMAVDLAAWAEAWVAVRMVAAWAVTAVVKGIRRNLVLTAKKFWNVLPKKPVDSSLKFPKNSPSTRFMPPLRRTFATNTTWVTHQTVRLLTVVITKLF